MKQARSLVCHTIKIAEPWSGLEFSYSGASHFLFFFFLITYSQLITNNTKQSGWARNRKCVWSLRAILQSGNFQSILETQGK